MMIDFFVWWYGSGWLQVVRAVHERCGRILAGFSVGLLATTLFAPFRQIDAASVRGSVAVQFHAWLGRTFSRLFGAVLRSFMISIGLVSAMSWWLLASMWLMVWLFLPALPILGAVLWLAGVSL